MLDRNAASSYTSKANGDAIMNTVLDRALEEQNLATADLAAAAEIAPRDAKRDENQSAASCLSSLASSEYSCWDAVQPKFCR